MDTVNDGEAKQKHAVFLDHVKERKIMGVNGNLLQECEHCRLNISHMSSRIASQENERSTVGAWRWRNSKMKETPITQINIFVVVVSTETHFSA